MIHDVGDHDLADPAATLAIRRLPMRVLVWWRNEPLGEVVVHPDWSMEEMDDAMRRPFVDATAALELVGASLDRPTDASSLAVVVAALSLENSSARGVVLRLAISAGELRRSPYPPLPSPLEP